MFVQFMQPDTSDWWFQKLSVKKYSLFWQAHTRTAHFSELAQDLIVSILCPNPDNRITIEGTQPRFKGYMHAFPYSSSHAFSTDYSPSHRVTEVEYT